jgi:oligopeptide/dipeptide ABC transporter ATP-binding protein
MHSTPGRLDNECRIMSSTSLLELRALTLRIGRGTTPTTVLRSIDLTIRSGDSLGLVGESGSGKSQLLLAILGLSPPSAIVTGSIRYRDQELVGASRQQLMSVRGAEIGMVFQDPASALNPYLSIGTQLTEGLQAQRRLPTSTARSRAAELLEQVRIADPAACLKRYPHQLSGGMQQRVIIAMALMCEPKLLLCDEPTTALDMTVQAQIVELLRELRARTRVALLVVSHDLSVVAALTERVAVMYAGQIVELAPTTELLIAPQHPYSVGLQRSALTLSTALNEPIPAIAGNPPLLAQLPAGCSFAPRCDYVHARCEQSAPPLEATSAAHWRACHYRGALSPSAPAVPVVPTAPVVPVVPRAPTTPTGH